MGTTYPELSEPIRQFIESQPLFFVGTAPLAPEGHVNVSPKGLDTLRILGPRTIAYLDLTGSGIETVSHLEENGRIVLMFCALQGAPKIVRVHGRGRVIGPGHAEFGELASQFPDYEGKRSVILIEVTRISDSCGFGVPLLQLEGQRNQLNAWASRLGPEKLIAYRQEKNRVSIDGLAGLEKQA